MDTVRRSPAEGSLSVPLVTEVPCSSVTKAGTAEPSNDLVVAQGHSQEAKASMEKVDQQSSERSEVPHSVPSQPSVESTADMKCNAMVFDAVVRKRPPKLKRRRALVPGSAAFIDVLAVGFEHCTGVAARPGSESDEGEERPAKATRW